MAWETVREDLNIYSLDGIDRYVYSICSFCANGCGCYIAVKGNKIAGVLGNAGCPVNRGRLCPRGRSLWQANSRADRLSSPLIRNSAGTLAPATWEQAMELVVNRIRRQLRREGADSLAFFLGGRSLLEEYYTISKITRAGIGTHHVDASARLCTASAEWSLIENFGCEGAPACQEDLDQAEVVVCFGHNPQATNTILFERVLEHRGINRGKLIVIDPRQSNSASFADLSLHPRGGTNVALMNGIIHLLIKNGWIDREFIESHTIGYQNLSSTAAWYPPEAVQEITGVPAPDLEQAAAWIGMSRSTITILGQGVYQTPDATAAASLVNAMHLITGKIGKPGSGPFPVTGQPGSLSNREVGGAGFYPGFRNCNNPGHLEEIASLWNVDTSTLPVGEQTHIMKQLDLIEEGRIKLLWVTSASPAVSLPNHSRVTNLLKKVFLIVQDPFPSATTELADVVLPVAMWGEKEGTMTSAERRVNLLRQAVPPPFGLPSCLEIMLDFAARMGFKDRDGHPLIAYSTPEEAFNEWRRVSWGQPCDMSGMTYEKIEALGGIQWPCNDQHPLGCVRLYADGHFSTGVDDAESYGRDIMTGRQQTRSEFEKIKAGGRALIHAVNFQPPLGATNTEYPFLLSTSKPGYQAEDGAEATYPSELQTAATESYVTIHPDDAWRHGIAPGDLVRLSSRRGNVCLAVHVSAAVQPGMLFIPVFPGSVHGKQVANELVLDAWDRVSKQPMFKHTACKLEKVNSQDGGDSSGQYSTVADSDRQFG